MYRVIFEIMTSLFIMKINTIFYKLR